MFPGFTPDRLRMTTPSPSPGPPGFLSGGGAMGALMRAHDWAATPLGPPEGWPQSLRTVVNLMLTSSFPMFAVWGPELSFLYNDAYRPVLGSKPEGLGRPFREVWSDLWPVLSPLVDRALAGEATFHEDQLLVMERHGYREETWFTFSYSPVRDEDGRVAGMFCACTETTGKVQAERRLAAEGERLRDLFRQTPGFMHVCRGPDHVFELANEAYLRLVGRRDLIGRPVREALPEVVEQGFIDMADRVYRTGEPVFNREAPVLLQRAPGEPLEQRFVTSVIQPIRDAEGRITGIFVQGNDVTEERRTADALRREEERFRHLANLAPAFVWFGNPDGTLNYLSDRWYAYTGQTPEQALPSGWADTLHADDLARTLAVWEDARTRGVLYEVEVRYRRRDGEYRWFIARAEPLRDADGRVTAWFGTSTDIHDRRVAEAELQRLNATLEARVAEEAAGREQAQVALLQAQKTEALGQMTGGVAHDFNNLLQALGGCLHMIERRAPEVRPLVEAGRQAVDRGAKLVQQLMAFARRQALRPEAVDLRDRLLGMSDLLGRALRADIELATDFPAGLWPVEADPTQLELAVINLAVNARDAMPGGGRLVLRAANAVLAPGDPSGLAGDFVRLEVADTGTGMAEEVRAKAFDPFFTTKEVGQGSGLGLSQVYGFARQSGGTARIDTTPGSGTTVTLLLRRSRQPVRGQAAEAPCAAPARTGGRVLVVEDDPVVATTVAAALEDAGYEVARAGTADEALPVLAGAAKLDLLFSDVVMPGRLSGVDLAREAKRLRPGLPIVLTTGYSETVAQAEGVRVLPKPYRIEELVRTLDTALSEGRAPPA